MPFLLLVILAVVAYFYFRAKTKHLSEEEQQKAAKKWLLGGGLVLLAVLAFMKGQVIIGAIASLFAMLMRGLPLLKFLPVFKKVFDEAHKPSQSELKNNSSMTRSEAASILGVSEQASEEEVLDAHKRLIQKIHPDKGGSEGLAAQINLARKVMLGLDT